MPLRDIGLANPGFDETDDAPTAQKLEFQVVAARVLKKTARRSDALSSRRALVLRWDSSELITENESA